MGLVSRTDKTEGTANILRPSARRLNLLMTLRTSALAASCGFFLFCADLLAGGFWLSLGNPVASHDPKAKNAVLLVKPTGCISPADSTVSGTAEGVVEGKRESVPLQLVRLSEPATWAVVRQWPREGVWVVRLTATYQDRTTSALVPIGSDGFHRESAKFFRGAAPENELMAMLGH